MEKGRKIKAFIVDDELQAIKNLTFLVESFCKNVAIIGSAQSVQDALQEIVRHKPELLFLDIEMPGQSGFDLLDKITDPDIRFIFITSYNQHAVRAFRYSAVDYLLKPIDIEELNDAITKVVEKNDSRSFRMNLELLADNLKNSKPSKIAVSTSLGKYVIEINNIIAVVADGSYSKIMLSEGKDLFLSKGLSTLEGQLEELDFFRVHKSYLINMEHIKSYTSRDGGVITLTKEIKVPVSRRNKDSFEKRFNTYFRA